METDEQSTYFFTVLKVNNDFKRQIDPNQKSDQVSDEVSARVSDQESDQVNNQVSDEVEVVLTYCRSFKSRKEIPAGIGLANHTANYRRHIVPLLEKQWVKMTIAENPKHRNQKYVTTESGSKMLGK